MVERGPVLLSHCVPADAYVRLSRGGVVHIVAYASVGAAVRSACGCRAAIDSTDPGMRIDRRKGYRPCRRWIARVRLNMDRFERGDAP